MPIFAAPLRSYYSRERQMHLDRLQSSLHPSSKSKRRMDEKTITQQLEELQLIKCSLLPNEILRFIDDDDDSIWAQLLDDYVESNEAIPHRAARGIRPAEFLIKLDGLTKVWLEVRMPDVRGRDALVSVKGDRLSRAEQERWRDVIREKQREVEDAAE